MKRIVFALIAVVALASPAGAQLHGLGRIQGKTVDESGEPIADVSVKATLPGSAGSIDATSDKKGEWMVGGMGRGEWDVVFEKPGFAPRKAKVTLDVELAKVPPITVTMKKG